jgi:amino-acid N-acetyltransferase
MEITQPEPAELEQIKQILKLAALPTTDLTQAHLHRFLVARDGATLAGVGGLEIFGQDALLRSVVVDPVYRERGLGSHLVHRLEEAAQEQGADTIYLLTTSAERFFSLLGYRRIERRQTPPTIQATPEFTSLCPDTAVCMQIDL